MSRQPTPERVREAYRYEDGKLYWRKLTYRRKPGPIGAHAGHGGRLQVNFDGSHQYVHRLIWVWHYGEWPKDQLDHINGDKLDNRIENLREVDNGANSQNRRIRGVTYERRAGKWRARIMVDYRSHSLGYFATEQEALDAYQAAKLKMHESYATGIAATS